MQPAGFELTISVGERRQIHAFDLAANRTSETIYTVYTNIYQIYLIFTRI